MQPEKTAQYDAVGKHNIQTSIANEQGTLAMYSVKRKDNPNMAYMVELYANDAAYQTHRATPHFQHYLRDTGAMIADKTFYEIAPSELGNKGGVRWGSLKSKIERRRLADAPSVVGFAKVSGCLSP